MDYKFQTLTFSTLQNKAKYFWYVFIILNIFVL